jgi:hypothetical protein
MEQTAYDAYGFISYTPAYPGGLAVANATDLQQQGMPHEVAPKLGFGHENPLFWVLIIVLIITGYISLGFNVGLKKIFKLGGKLG